MHSPPGLFRGSSERNSPRGDLHHEGGEALALVARAVGTPALEMPEAMEGTLVILSWLGGMRPRAGCGAWGLSSLPTQPFCGSTVLGFYCPKDPLSVGIPIVDPVKTQQARKVKPTFVCAVHHPGCWAEDLKLPERRS